MKTRNVIVSLCLFLVLLSGNAFAQYCDSNPTYITGTARWPSNTNITCAGDVNILGGRLTIGLGTVINMPANANIYVGPDVYGRRGTLEVNGVSMFPTVFQPSNSNYRWAGIRLSEYSARNSLQNVQITGCGSYGECLVVSDPTGSTSLDSIHIHKYLNASDTTHGYTGLAIQDAGSVSADDIYVDGFETGISIEGSTASPQALTNILVWDNDTGVLIDDSSEVSISESCIYGNDATGVLVVDGKLTMDDTQVYANSSDGFSWSGYTYHTGIFFSQYADTSSVVSPDNEIYLNYPSGPNDYNAEMINTTGSLINAQSNEIGCVSGVFALPTGQFITTSSVCH